MTIFKLTAQITTRDTFVDRPHRRDFIRLLIKSITCFAYSVYFTIEISKDFNLMGKT